MNLVCGKNLKKNTDNKSKNITKKKHTRCIKTNVNMKVIRILITELVEVILFKEEKKNEKETIISNDKFVKRKS